MCTPCKNMSLDNFKYVQNLGHRFQTHRQHLPVGIMDLPNLLFSFAHPVPLVFCAVAIALLVLVQFALSAMTFCCEETPLPAIFSLFCLPSPLHCDGTSLLSIFVLFSNSTPSNSVQMGSAVEDHLSAMGIVIAIALLSAVSLLCSSGFSPPSLGTLKTPFTQAASKMMMR